jgi:putative metallopeptidase DUF4344
MLSRTWIWLALAFFVCGLASPVAGKQATFTVDVPPGRWKALRVQQLPKEALVAVEVQSTGQVAVAFARHDASSARSLASLRPLFHSLVDNRLAFSVTIPAPGDYVVVLDNRAAAEPRTITVTVRATPGNQEGALPPQLSEVERQLSEIERQLTRLFIFEPFPIRVQRCGIPQAFSGPSGIILCQEFGKKLLTTLGDKTKASDTLLFTLFHELGHMLLQQWQYPFFANEEVADEFATALLVMLGQQERVRVATEFLAANPSMAEALAKVYRDDRHPLSVQRARNILRWLRDPQLVHKWQKIFVPHMHTVMLKQLERQPTAWTDPALVAQELATRR